MIGLISLLLRPRGGAQGAVPRELLAEWLWPEYPGDAGRANLRVALHWLRKLLEPEGVTPGSVIRAGRFELEILPGAVADDVCAFETLLKLAAHRAPSEAAVLLRGALALAPAPYLIGHYDEWATSEQQRLERQVSRATALLTDALLRLDELEPAEQTLRTQLARDPADEWAARRMAELTERLRSRGSWIDGAWSRSPVDLPAGPEGMSHPRPPFPRCGSQPNSTPRMGQPGAVPKLPGTFIGRGRELMQLLQLLEAPGDESALRLVTLLGPAGVGKSRLAFEAVVRARLPALGLVRGVDLQNRSLADAAARALGVTLTPERSPAARLAELLPDNSEAAVAWLLVDGWPEDAAPGDELESLLEAAPGLRVMVTSRSRLGVRGEAVLRVNPLDICEGQATEQDSLGEAERLFLERARATGAQTASNQMDLRQVQQLCAALDGVPLAIELAAARLRGLSLSDLLADVLTRELPGTARHERICSSRQGASLERTVRSAVECLEAEQLRALSLLSRLKHPWSLNTARVLLHGLPRGVADRPPTAQVVEALCDRSLVQPVRLGGVVRYRILRLVRGAALPLGDDPEPAQFEFRLARAVLAEVWRAQRRVGGLESAAAIAQLRADYPLARQVLESTDEPTADFRLAAIAGRIAVGLAVYWEYDGSICEGRSRIRSLMRRLAAADSRATLSDRRMIARLHAASGRLAFLQDDYAEAIQHLTSALQSFEALNCPSEAGQTLSLLAYVPDERGRRYEAHRMSDLRRAIRLGETVGDRRGAARAHWRLGALLEARPDPDWDDAREQFHLALDLAERTGDEETAVRSLWRLGTHELARSKTAEGAARTLPILCEALQRASRLAHPQLEAYVLCHLAQAHLEQAAWSEVRRCANQATARFDPLGDRWGMAASRMFLAEERLAQGDSSGARRLAVRAREIFLEFGAHHEAAWAEGALARADELDISSERQPRSLTLG